MQVCVALNDKEQAKVNFNAYVQKHELQEHLEFAKAIKDVFGAPRSYRLEHNGQAIWPPKKEKP